MRMKLYQHFKGGLYIVTSDNALEATNGNEQGDRRVAYTACINEVQYSREFNEFHELIEYEGKTGPRFRFIADPADIMPNGGHL
jgi:hypothetical protein